MKEKSKTNKKIAVIVGVLFIIGTVAGILSVVITGPVFSSPDYLALIASDQNSLVTGALMVLVMGFTLAMVPVVIFPVLKKHNEILALGYVVFRGALEPITYIATAFSWLLLIPLSQEYMTSGAAASPYYQTLSYLMVEASKISGTLVAVVFPLGAIMFYVVLYQGKLIPRWISVWGLIAVVLHFLTSGVWGLFTLDHSMTALQDMLAFPIFAQEMVMAVWMIVKGFNAIEIISPTAGTETNKA